MEEKKMQELNLDEMDKVSGGGWVDENGKTYMYPDKCLCGGRFICHAAHYLSQTQHII